MQAAATTALNGPVDFMATRNATFKERSDVVVKGLRAVGLEVENPKATSTSGPPFPKDFRRKSSGFKVLDAINVWMIPGSMYGKYGEGYLRIALTHPTKRLAEAMKRLKEFMA